MKKFRLYEHPWLSLVAVVIASIFSIALTGTVIFGVIGLPDDSSFVQFIQGISHQVLTGFVLAPFVLHLPKGKKPFRQYLDDIGFRKSQPFYRLVLLALTCYLVLALLQVTGTIVYRLSEGLPASWFFIREVLDLSGDLPPRSAGLLTTIPSMFEEVAFRGIVLTVFLRVYREREAIIFSSIGFGLIHLLNLMMGRELVWVIGQVIWAFCIGLFYGYVFVKTGSILPSMMVHYLSNVFIGSLTGYMQVRATTEIEVLYGVIFSLGILPSGLMILWARFYTTKWLSDEVIIG